MHERPGRRRSAALVTADATRPGAGVARVVAVGTRARRVEEMPLDPTHTAVGTWSGGRFMRFGEPLDDDRFLALIRPDGDVRTVLTADTYGGGEADTLLGRALEGTPREDYCLVGAVGHDFYTGEREGAKGYPRFTDARLRGPDDYGSYLRMATERSLERIGVDAFDVLLLHNPDRSGYTSPAVWDGMEALRSAGLTRLIGVAPGPANGFTLDLIECFERFGSSIDWAMLILNPMEPWPGELALPAAEAHDIEVITRVVDYGACSGTTCFRGTPSQSTTTACSDPTAGSSAAVSDSTECGRSRDGTG